MDKEADAPEGAGQHLARNLVSLRHARTLTQDALAAASGLPRSTIANLESGEANPSLAVLVKVAGTLGVPIDELLAAPRAKVRKWAADEIGSRQRGRGVAERPLVPEPTPEGLLYVMEFAADARLRGTPHLPGTREYFTCLDGRVEIVVAGDRHELGAGDLSWQHRAFLPQSGYKAAGARRIGGHSRQGGRVIVPIPLGTRFGTSDREGPLATQRIAISDSRLAVRLDESDVTFRSTDYPFAETDPDDQSIWISTPSRSCSGGADLHQGGRFAPEL
jgi:XRE family transcriptional regulator, regulator of sulfur utilization